MSDTAAAPAVPVEETKPVETPAPEAPAVVEPAVEAPATVGSIMSFVVVFVLICASGGSQGGG